MIQASLSFNTCMYTSRNIIQTHKSWLLGSGAKKTLWPYLALICKCKAHPQVNHACREVYQVHLLSFIWTGEGTWKFFSMLNVFFMLINCFPCVVMMCISPTTYKYIFSCLLLTCPGLYLLPLKHGSVKQSDGEPL
jgi:hypothetical protein